MNPVSPSLPRSSRPKEALIKCGMRSAECGTEGRAGFRWLLRLLWLFAVGSTWAAFAAEESTPKTLAVSRPSRTGEVDFYREVVPVLQANCLPCHNKTTSKADLLLETPADMIKGGENGPVIVPGKSAESLLFKVATHAEKPRMPPKENKVNAVNLTPEQLGLLALWIDQGAKASDRRNEVIAWQPISESLNAIYSVAISADGQFAACGRANRLFLYHLPTGQLIGQLADPALATNAHPATAHLDLVNALAFNPTDDTLASGGFAEVKLWRRTETKPEAFTGAVAWLTNQLKSDDGTRSVSLDTNGVARLLNADGKAVAELRFAHPQQRLLTRSETSATIARQRLDAAKATVEAAAREISAQQERLKKSREAIAPATKAVADKEPAAITARREVALLEGRLAHLEQQPFKGTNFAALQKQVQEKLEAARKAAEGVEAELAKVQRGLSNAENERELATLGLQQAQAAQLAAAWQSREREQVAKVAEANLAEVKRVAETSAVRAVGTAISHDGRLVVTADAGGGIHLWSGSDGRPVGSADTRLPSVDRFSFGEGVVFVGNSSQAVRWSFLPAWNLAGRLGTGDPQSPIVDRVNALAFSPDGQRLASGSGEPTRGSMIHVWDPQGGDLLYALRDLHSDVVQSLAFSPDGKFLASGGADRFARVTETGSGRLVRSLEGHTGHVLSVAWKADGDVLASGSADFQVKLWNWARGERLKNVEGFGKEVTGLQFLGTSDQFLAASGAARVRLLNLKGEETGTLPAGNLFVQAAAVSADGTVAVGGGDDGVLRIWSVGDRKLLSEFAPSTGTLAAGPK